MKEETKKKLDNLFDNDPTNSNNIFDRIQDQMTSHSVDDKIDHVMEMFDDIKVDVDEKKEHIKEDLAEKREKIHEDVAEKKEKIEEKIEEIKEHKHQ